MTQNILQKSGILEFSRLMLATCVRVEAPVARVTQKVLRLPVRLTRGWNFQSRKTLRQFFFFFKILSYAFLATCFGDLFATQSSCKKLVFFTMRVLFRSSFKTFHFSFTSPNYSSSCLSFPLSKSPCSLTNSPYSSSLLHQSSRKGMDSFSFSLYFTFFPTIS